jgi:3-oxoacyl-[acyl-carrier-protein] synthase-1
VASLLNRDEIIDRFASINHKNKVNYTILEKTAILSVYYALKNTSIDTENEKTLFILSTTKGNVDLLENNEIYEKDRVHLWRTAQLITQFFQNKNEPIVVSNACISGVAAQITAERALKSGRFKDVIVTGIDLLSKFIISGFQSFKALSPERCRPFDINRTGLNLGEAATTIIYSVEDNINKIPENAILLKGGAICNDANHISGPSRTGEGLFNAVSQILPLIDKNDIAFINAHGTATPYNDDMESVAIDRLNLNDIPINSLKGYFGHSLGAAGLLETVISSYALLENIVLKSIGFEQLGVLKPLNVSKDNSNTHKNSFIKLVSGFGGVNAAIAIQKNN